MYLKSRENGEAVGGQERDAFIRRPDVPRHFQLWGQGDSDHQWTYEIADYRGTSLIRTRNPQGPYRRPMPRVLERF